LKSYFFFFLRLCFFFCLELRSLHEVFMLYLPFDPSFAFSFFLSYSAVFIDLFVNAIFFSCCPFCFSEAIFPGCFRLSSNLPLQSGLVIGDFQLLPFFLPRVRSDAFVFFPQEKLFLRKTSSEWITLLFVNTISWTSDFFRYFLRPCPFLISRTACQMDPFPPFWFWRGPPLFRSFLLDCRGGFPHKLSDSGDRLSSLPDLSPF